MIIEIKNFQSIADAKIETKPLTVIVGPSDSGKSAIIRAISACLYNTPGNNYIRYGEKSCNVRLLYGKDKILFNKGKKTEYKINSKTYSAIGRGQFDKIHDLGFPEIDADGRKVRPQVSRQHDAPFIISDEYSPTTVAAILGNLSDSAIVNKAKRLAEKDIKATSSRIKYKQEELDEVNKDVQKMSEFNTIEQKFTHLMSMYTQLERKQEAFDENATKIQLVQDSGKEIKNLRESLKVVKDMMEKVNVSSLEQLKLDKERLDSIQEMSKIIVALRNLLKLLGEKLKSLWFFLSPIEEKKSAMDKITQLSSLRDEIDSLKANKKSVIDSLKATKGLLAEIKVCPTCGQVI